MRTLVIPSALAAVALVTLVEQESVRACGGCFAPQETVTTVESHRMVVSLATTETILWDQIRYTGDPEDFVWVLPVPSAEARVELGSEEFFALLEAQSQPIVTGPLPPQLFCPDEGGGIGCGGGADSAASPDGGGNGVDVYREETVGPYETVVIGSEDPDALQTWLTDNGYAVPEAMLPTMAWYANMGNVFVVLRLSPGQQTTAMQPVRVRYPGYMASFPLRMVKAGAAQLLELSLWVIAEQRYETANYPTVEIDRTRLAWNWNTASSNYEELFDAMIDEAGGNAWIVEQSDLFQDEFSDGFTFEYFAAPDDTLAATAMLTAPPRLTRLRTRMLLDHLGADLELRPASNPLAVSRNYQTVLEIDRPAEPDCDDDEQRGACRAAPGRRARGLLAGLAVFGVAMVLLRFRRR